MGMNNVFCYTGLNWNVQMPNITQTFDFDIEASFLAADFAYGKVIDTDGEATSTAIILPMDGYTAIVVSSARLVGGSDAGVTTRVRYAKGNTLYREKPTE